MALSDLKIIGNSVIPGECTFPPLSNVIFTFMADFNVVSVAGPIPRSLFGASLETVNLQSTALTSLADDAFSKVSGNLKSLSLISNSKLGSKLPSLSGSGNMETLQVILFSL